MAAMIDLIKPSATVEKLSRNLAAESIAAPKFHSNNWCQDVIACVKISTNPLIQEKDFAAYC